VSARILVSMPVRVLSTLATVRLWKEPSSVTLHLIVTILTNSRLDQVTLMFEVELESILAEAVLIAVASKSVAMSAVRPSFADVRIDCLSEGASA
jgi:hypothetical protein